MQCRGAVLQILIRVFSSCHVMQSDSRLASVAIHSYFRFSYATGWSIFFFGCQEKDWSPANMLTADVRSQQAILKAVYDGLRNAEHYLKTAQHSLGDYERGVYPDVRLGQATRDYDRARTNFEKANLALILALPLVKTTQASLELQIEAWSKVGPIEKELDRLQDELVKNIDEAASLASAA